MKNPNLICFRCKNWDDITGCKAFEDIPKEILNGENDHTKPLSDQKNEIVFETIDDAEK